MSLTLAGNMANGGEAAPRSRACRRRPSRSPVLPSLTLAVLVAVVVLSVATPARAGLSSPSLPSSTYTRIATLDGTMQITAADYKNGLSQGSNSITKCSDFADKKGNFVLLVQMGDFNDYIIPATANVTLCDVLTSTSAQGKYRWSSVDPLTEQWDGYSEPVGLMSRWENALGGASANFLSRTSVGGSTSRPTISFWGFNDEAALENGKTARLGHKGGCCAHVAHEPSSWHKAFTISIAPVADPDKLYMVWASKPAVVVAAAPIVFMVKIWNFRGEPLMARPNFTVDLNGVEQVKESATNKRATLIFESDLNSSRRFDGLAEGAEFTLTVSVNPIANLESGRRHLSLTLPVVAPFAAVDASLTPCHRSTGVSEMLHFGPPNYSIKPVSRAAAFEYDWFAAASHATSGAAGESFLRPVEGHASVAEADPALAPSTQLWTKVVSTDADGAFTGRHPRRTDPANDKANGTLQFYAFTLYSASELEVVLQIVASEAYAIYLGHTELELPAGSSTPLTGQGEAVTTRTTFGLRLVKGYQQVLIKLFASHAPVDNEVYSKLNFKVFGTGVAHTLERPIKIPKRAYKMTSDCYMYYLLNSGTNAVDMLFADSIAQDLIGVHSAAPKVGNTVVSADQLKTENGQTDPNAQRSWKRVVFFGGNIPIDGRGIPANRQYAVKYVALALYNQYDNDVSVDWQLVVKGHTEMYMDGVLQYSAPHGTIQDAFVTTALTPGWHQLIVRLATPRDLIWIFRFYMTFEGYHLIGSLQARQSHTLPFGLRAIGDREPVQAMLELTAKDQAVTGDKLGAMIPFNPADDKESTVTFLPPGVPLTVDANGQAKPRKFYAYDTASLSLSSADGPSETHEFEWVPTAKSQDGLWGHVAEDTLAGGYYRLWAYTLYAAGPAEIQAGISFVGGFAMWLDGVLAGSASWTKESKGHLQEASVALRLTKGWHQVVLKLQVPSTFALNDTKVSGGTGLASWGDGTAVCKTMHGSAYKVCESAAFCPFGAPRLGVGLPLTPKDTTRSPNLYAPVSDGANRFIQLAGSDDSVSRAPQPVCSTMNITAATEDELLSAGAGKIIGCCEAIRTPFISVELRVPSGTDGKVGYTYHELIVIATPKITRTAAYFGTQSVTIESETPEASLRYRRAGDDSWTEYTAPFTVTSATTVQAQAYLGSSTSGTVSMKVDVPEAITFDRHDCLYNVACPLTFTGANLGNAASLVARNQHPKVVQSYANISFARTQHGSSLFSGVAEMDADTLTANMLVPQPSDAAVDVAEYVVMVYDSKNGTQEGYISIRRSVALVPRSVLADKGAVFMADAYLRDTDTILFPQLYKALDEQGKELDSYLGEDECSKATCTSAFVDYGITKGSPVSAARTFEADLSGAVRDSLTCMCVCASCHGRYLSGATNATFELKRDRVLGLPVAIKLIDSACANGNGAHHPDAGRPRKDVGKIVIIVLIPVLAVLVLIGVFLFIYFRVRGRRPLVTQHTESTAGTATVENCPTVVKGLASSDREEWGSATNSTSYSYSPSARH